MTVILTCTLALVLQPPSLPSQTATTGIAESTGGAPASSPFSPGVFPLGATMVSADPKGELSIETIASEVMPQTTTRQVAVQGPDGRTQSRTEQYTVTATVYKVTRRVLPPDTKIYRSGREISDEERRSLRERTPLFVSSMGSPTTPPGQGYEAVFGNALVAFIPPGKGTTPSEARPMKNAPTTPQPIGDGTTIEKEVVDKANEARAAAGLPPFMIDATLMKAARQHSANMAKVGKLEHLLEGKGPAERLSDLGMQTSSTGENVAQGQRSAAEAMETWMSSPGHRGNILNPNFTHIGVAKADSPNGPYWTQVFARIDQQP